MTTTAAGTAAAASTSPPDLSLFRLHLMRAGYVFIGVGLALVTWPLVPDAHSLPLYEGVTLCLLTAMSLLAFLGLRYPVSSWCRSSSSRLRGSSIVAVIPWRYARTRYVHSSGDPWRRLPAMTAGPSALRSAVIFHPAPVWFRAAGGGTMAGRGAPPGVPSRADARRNP